MKTTSIGVLALLLAAVMSQPVTKEEPTASKRATVLTEVQDIPDSESEASENKEKRGAARLTPVSSNSLTADRPGHAINLNQQNQLSEIAQLTQLPPQAPQHLFAPHPYSFVLPYHQPKLTYTPAKNPYLLPPQQQQILQLPAFGPQHQQYMLIIPPQQSPAQHQLLMLIAPPAASGFHYLAQPQAPSTGLPPQHLINFYAGQPQHQPQQSQIQPQREQPLLHHIPQQNQQQIHIPNNQPQHQATRVIFTPEQPQHHFSYQTIPQEHQQPLFSPQPLIPKIQPHQHQPIHQQNQQQQYLIDDSAPTPATLVNTYGTRLHSQPSHQNQQQQQHQQQQQQQQQHHQQQQQQQQQQYKTIIKV